MQSTPRVTCLNYERDHKNAIKRVQELVQGETQIGGNLKRKSAIALISSLIALGYGKSGKCSVIE